jgi:hypothetical protein
MIELFRELARQHKKIKGFIYGKGYEKGAGNEFYPLVWVDDPIYGNSDNNTVQYTVNVDFTDIPVREEDVPRIQNEMIDTGLVFAEKIKQTRSGTGVGLRDFSFLTLRDYYDNNSAGVRFTYTLVGANPVDRCSEDFDPDKEFEKGAALPDFDTDNPNGCAVFNGAPGLPEFSVK